MNVDRPICVLVGALGGQGGGVLTDWLVEAARAAGFPAQATSIPGVAQRTGATTYYFELFPQRNPPADPVFCLFPSAGDVDLVAALEPTEAGRALERGYVSGRTTVVTSQERLYSVAEKSVAGDGTLDAAPILKALKQAGKRLILVDPAEASGSQLNALLFGAIIGSGVLPISNELGRSSIQAKGLAVSANLAGYDAGLQITVEGNGRFPSQPAKRYLPPPVSLEGEVAAFPEALRPLVGHALARLEEYQDQTYARRYLERLKPILVADSEARVGDQTFRLTAEVAQRLAAWMSYEDVIRVAQLKTKPGRLARIHAEVNAGPGEPVKILDYLSPGRAELMGVLPTSIARLVPGGNGHNGKSSPGLRLAWPTSSPFGFAALKFLAALQRLRPRTEAFALEQKAIDKWLDAVLAVTPKDYDLACQVAELSVWARGYGEVRAHGLACLDTLLENWSLRLEQDIDGFRDEVKQSLFAARHDPDVTCE